jgi:ATP-dependent DNA helicase RecG
MNEQQITEKLQHLRNLPGETEVVEFKEAKNGYDFTKLGKYFSALSNEANLQGEPFAWMVFGIEDKHHHIVGTQFRSFRKDLDSLKCEIGNKTTNRITFIEIYELHLPEGRVVMFQIPAAPKGFPIAFEGHYYGRDGEEIVPLNLEEIERIRAQATTEDWSAKIIEDASIADLDTQALQVARQKFKDKSISESFYDEIDFWDTKTFLDKAKITIKGKVTHAAIILLGKAESTHFLLPSVAEITWKLDTEQKAYEHFGLPQLLNTTKVLQRIRNYQYKFFPDNELLSISVNKYETRVILEALNNAIAHQEYPKQARIILTEKVDKLIFQNAGRFFAGNPEEYFYGDKTPDRYRNPWLAKAMVNLGMIDTVGYGIHTMFLEQKKRYFPLPDYSKSTQEAVVLEIYGHEIDVNYTKALMEHKNLDLKTVILLDRVQKRLTINKDDASILRKQNLIEGRSPNFFISAAIAKVTGNMAQYIKNRSFDDRYFKDLVIEYIKKNGKSTKDEIDNLLLDKLPAVLDNQQKKNKIRNLIYALSKREQVIENHGTNRNPIWNIKSGV